MSPHRRFALCLLCLAALASLLAPAGAQGAFGIDTFSAAFVNEDESPDTLAGSHPYEFVTHIVMNQDAQGRREGTLQDILIELPPGMAGDPLALPRCTRADFDFGFVPLCPGDSEVGVAELELNQGGVTGRPGIYNLTPTPGSPLTLGFSIDKNNGLVNASVRTGGDYGANVASPPLPVANELQQVTTRIWGVPMEKSHDLARLCVPEGVESTFENCSSNAPPAAFLSLPTRCGEQLESRLVVHSTEGDEDEAIVTTPALKGCEAIPFEPQIKRERKPRRRIRRAGWRWGSRSRSRGTPNSAPAPTSKTRVVTLPAGLAVNPSAAIGRSACSLAQINLKGSGPANCPDAAKVGTVTVTSPLVDHPLRERSTWPGKTKTPSTR